jgi:hypothetical protein
MWTTKSWYLAADPSHCKRKGMGINNCSLAVTCCVNSYALYRIIIIIVMKIPFIDIGDTDKEHQSICLTNTPFKCAKRGCRLIGLLLVCKDCDISSIIWNGVCVCVCALRACVYVGVQKWDNRVDRPLARTLAQYYHYYCSTAHLLDT